MANRPPGWANEVVVEVLCLDKDWTLRTGGEKLPYLRMWCGIPDWSGNWTNIGASCVGDIALDIADWLEDEGDGRYILRGRIHGRRKREDGAFWDPEIIIKEVDHWRKVEVGSIMPREMLGFAGEERSRLQKLASATADEKRRRQTAQKFYMDAAQWALDNGFLETLTDGQSQA